jgi:hypothetical protein
LRIRDRLLAFGDAGLPDASTPPPDAAASEGGGVTDGGSTTDADGILDAFAPPTGDSADGTTSEETDPDPYDRHGSCRMARSARNGALPSELVVGGLLALCIHRRRRRLRNAR